jgi:poly(glycerol-phosphate) alpha-glucosyltransferase
MKKNILMLTASASRMAGGVQFAVRDLTAKLASNNNFDYKIMSFDDIALHEDKIHWKGLNLVTYPYIGPSNFRFSVPYLKAVLSEKCELIQLHGIWTFPAMAASIRKRFINTPMIISPHGMLDPWIVSRNRWKKSSAEFVFENHLRSTNSIYRALNLSEAESIRVLCPKATIVIIPNGVELPILVDVEHQISNGERTILFLGRLHEKKRVLELIEAIKNVWKNSKFRPKLLVAGWGDSNYVKLVQQHISGAPEGCCEFLGPVFGAEKDQLLRGVDSLILPSISEGLPMAILEACAYGKPVLISKHCNLPDLYTDGAAIQVSIESDCLATELIEYCTLSDTEHNRMGKQARISVELKYNWDSIATQFETLTNDVLCGRTPSEVFLY